MKKTFPKYPPWMIFTPLIVIITTLILNHLMRQPLYKMGVDLIYQMQSHSNIIFDLFFVTITMIIDPTVIFFLFFLTVILSLEKRKSFVLLVFLLINLYFAALLKALDADPRPIWTDQYIRNIGFYCPVQYGNPSGHSWFSIILGFGVLLQYFGPGKNNRNIFIAILISILVPISRMYLGAHSLNQVLQGATMGLAMCMFLALGIKKDIQYFLTHFNRRMSGKIYILILHALYIMAYLLSRDDTVPQQWAKNIQQQCHRIMNLIQLNFLVFLVNAAVVNILAGISFGFEELTENQDGRTYLDGRWEINQQRYQLTRGRIYYFIIHVLLMGSGIIVAGIFSIYIQHKLFVYIIVGLGSFISGYIYTAKTYKLLFRWRIIAQRTPY